MSPRNTNELAELLRSVRAEKVPWFDLRQMSRVLEFTPEDMTVTVESGISLAALQQVLAQRGQWLPIDPPDPAAISIHELLAQDLSGPRRFGYGTVREHLIGMKVMLADGRTIKSGGKVVKNVAGYDLAKLFIGARDSLGVIVEATFKLRPLPEAEQFVCAGVSIEHLARTLCAVLDASITPVVLDVFRGQVESPALGGESIGNSARSGSGAVIVLGFAGTREEVEWQMQVAREMEFNAESSLDHDAVFWKVSEPVNKLSVLPSRLTDAVADLGTRPFIARAGNGVIYYRGEPLRAAPPEAPRTLMQRVKRAYDPKNFLPEFIA